MCGTFLVLTTLYTTMLYRVKKFALAQINLEDFFSTHYGPMLFGFDSKLTPVVSKRGYRGEDIDFVSYQRRSALLRFITLTEMRQADVTVLDDHHDLICVGFEPPRRPHRRSLADLALVKPDYAHPDELDSFALALHSCDMDAAHGGQVCTRLLHLLFLMECRKQEGTATVVAKFSVQGKEKHGSLRFYHVDVRFFLVGKVADMRASTDGSILVLVAYDAVDGPSWTREVDCHLLAQEDFVDHPGERFLGVLKINPYTRDCCCLLANIGSAVPFNVVSQNLAFADRIYHKARGLSRMRWGSNLRFVVASDQQQVRVASLRFEDLKIKAEVYDHNTGNTQLVLFRKFLVVWERQLKKFVVRDIDLSPMAFGVYRPGLHVVDRLLPAGSSLYATVNVLTEALEGSAGLDAYTRADLLKPAHIGQYARMYKMLPPVVLASDDEEDDD